MFKKLIKILIVMPVVAFLVGCNPDGASVEFGSLIDFKKSRIDILGTGVANGSTFLYLEVRSINSNGSVNTGWVPQLSIASGAATIIHSCSATDGYGVSRCSLTSTVPGIKTVQLDNALNTTVQGFAEFITPILSKTITSIVPGSNIANTVSGGHTVSASLSSLSAPLKYEDPTGHIVYLSLIHI